MPCLDNRDEKEIEELLEIIGIRLMGMQRVFLGKSYLLLFPARER
jgi:hypothetical protein